jgi:hypothetical protein
MEQEDLQKKILELHQIVSDLKNRVSLLEAKQPFRSSGKNGNGPLSTTIVPGRYSKKTN